MMYYLRAAELNWDTLVQLGIKLGAIAINSEGAVVATGGGAWDYIGKIYKPTGEVYEDGSPVTSPITDAQGNPWLHANLLSPVDLRAVAEELAVTDQEVAQALADLGMYFVTDVDGVVTAPVAPHRVFFGG